MTQYSLITQPTLFLADEIPPEGSFIPLPKTTEELLSVIHLCQPLICEHERRSAYLSQPSTMRRDIVVHLHEYAVHLQGEDQALTVFDSFPQLRPAETNSLSNTH